MKYILQNNKIIIENIKDFNIQQILECGQCFRFTKIDENKYKIIACNRVLTIEQNENCVSFYPCNQEDFNNIWIDYFDLNRDYSIIKEKICKNDNIMKKAVEYGEGIRILNQQPFECTLSFIISQNNNIPRIKGIIQKMSQTYGTKINDDFLFPTQKQLENVTVQQLSDLKMGFRAKYIFDALEKFNNNQIDIIGLYNLSTTEARNELLKIKGVGQKVADCILLFSLKHEDVFPTDVWIKRIMEQLYFDKKETPVKEIQMLAKKNWGNYTGFAQQYLFYYARSLNIGK